MPRSAHLSPNEVNDPAILSESTREYYQSTWGFDPVTDCQVLNTGGFRYEECYALSQDLSLQAVGVTIWARVDWVGEEIHNRIVFQRGEVEGIVECTHTVVYAGTVSEALPIVDKISGAQDRDDANTREIINPNRSNAVLPPWEHFAALKSYVAALGGAGIFFLFRHLFTQKGPEEDLPFGLNAMMLAQIAQAIRIIAPEHIDALVRELVLESFDEDLPLSIINRWNSLAKNFPLSKAFSHHPQEMFLWLGKIIKSTQVPSLPWNISQSFKREISRHRNFLLKKMDIPTLLHFIQHTSILDHMQEKIFNDTHRFGRVKILAPHIPWEQLRLEWVARDIAFKRAGKIGPFLQARSFWDFLESYPAAEVWPRFPFIVYDFPHHLLGYKTGHEVPVELRRARVERYCQEVIQRYTLHTGMSNDTEAKNKMNNWIAKILKEMEAILVKPFPIARVRSILDHFEFLSLGDLTNPLQAISHVQRRATVIACNLPQILQKALAVHWDYATRLALVGNPGTIDEVLNTLINDPQPCVRAAASARVRRKEATIHPFVGEVLDPGEIMLLLVSNPGVFFQFGVTTWGDGSSAYADWFTARPDEEFWNKEQVIGQAYAWGYTDGYFSQWQPENNDQFEISNLAFRGWKFYTCGHLPCVYLGTETWIAEADLIRMGEGKIDIVKDVA